MHFWENVLLLPSGFHIQVETQSLHHPLAPVVETIRNFSRRHSLDKANRGVLCGADQSLLSYVRLCWWDASRNNWGSWLLPVVRYTFAHGWGVRNRRCSCCNSCVLRAQAIATMFCAVCVMPRTTLHKSVILWCSKNMFRLNVRQFLVDHRPPRSSGRRCHFGGGGIGESQICIWNAVRVGTLAALASGWRLRAGLELGCHCSGDDESSAKERVRLALPFAQHCQFRRASRVYMLGDSHDVDVSSAGHPSSYYKQRSHILLRMKKVRRSGVFENGQRFQGTLRNYES